jgi:hypothetical protein
VSAEDRRAVIGLIDEAVASGARQSKACAVINLDERRLRNWRTSDGDGRTGGYRAEKQALRAAEKDAIVDAFRKKRQAKFLSYTENVYMRRRSIVGYEMMTERKMLPLTVYPLAIFTPDDFDNPFGKSPVEYLREMQKAMNTFIQTTILNANVGSNIRLIAAQGSIINRDAVVKHGSAPGGLFGYKPDPTLPNNGAPTPIYPAPLA